MAVILLYSFLSLFPIQENEYERAAELYQAGFYERSLRSVNSFLERNFVKEAYFFKHKVQVELGDLYGAAETLTGILQYYPGYAEARVSRAMVYRSLNLPQLVIDDLLYLINNPPDETNAIFFQIDPAGNSQVRVSTTATMAGLFHRIIAEQFLKLEKTEKAREYIDRAVTIDSIPENLLTRALVYNEMGQLSEAKAELQRVILMDSTHILAWYNLALMQPGISIPQKVVQDVEFAPMAGLKAVEAMNTGKLEEAESYFNLALQKDDQNPLTHINFGRLLLKTGKYVQARSHFQKAFELEDERIESLYLIGDSFSQQKKYEPAIAYYERYLSVDPTNPRVWYNAAVNYRMSGSKTDACRCLKRAVSYGMKVEKSSRIWSSCQ